MCGSGCEKNYSIVLLVINNIVINGMSYCASFGRVRFLEDYLDDILAKSLNRQDNVKFLRNILKRM